MVRRSCSGRGGNVPDLREEGLHVGICRIVEAEELIADDLLVWMTEPALTERGNWLTLDEESFDGLGTVHDALRNAGEASRVMAVTLFRTSTLQPVHGISRP